MVSLAVILPGSSGDSCHPRKWSVMFRLPVMMLRFLQRWLPSPQMVSHNQLGGYDAPAHPETVADPAAIWSDIPFLQHPLLPRHQVKG
mgnify:CR=1 FL=1